MPRTLDPIQTPNQHFTGNILDPSTLPPTTATSSNAHPTKGCNLSNRPWKLRPQKRASSLITSNRANNRSKSWDVKQAERTLRKEVKAAQAEMIEERKSAKREKRERRLENEKRRMENEYENAKKSMQKLNVDRVGVTLKGMNKKQLRQIKKTRMNSRTGVVEFVGAYAK